MINQQRALGSGFDARSTAADVLSGLDVGDKLIVVTGGCSGLGLETVRALSHAGARVVATARKDGVSADALPRRAEVEILDLSDQSSIRRFAHRMSQSGDRIDVVVNNAGLMACPEMRVGPGWEAQFGTNHLGHFILTNLLWPTLNRGARVVTVSSSGHHASDIRWHDIHFRDGRYDKWEAYGQSKTANSLFAVHLDRLGRDADIRAFSLHPGKIFTPLQRHLSRDEMVKAGWIDEGGEPADPTFKTPQQGAATQVWTATSPLLSGLGGLYCEDCDVAEMSAGPASFAGVCDYAVDPEQAARLWKVSAEMTGLPDAPGRTGAAG